MLLYYLPRAVLQFLASPYPFQSLLSLLALYSVRSTPQWTEFFSPYDSFHLYHIRAFWLSRLVPSSKRLIYDLIDSYTLNLERRLQQSNLRPKQLLLLPELFLIRRLESRFSLSTRSLLCTVSPVDLAMIKPQPSTECKLCVIPQGFESSPLSSLPPLTSSLKLIFFGNLSYYPNRQAVLFLARFFKRLSHQDHQKFKLTVAGRDISQSLRRLCHRSYIDVVSPVTDMKTLVQTHHLSVTPLFSGSGLQSKVIESMIWSRPVLITPLPFSALINPRRSDYYHFTDYQSLYSELNSIIADPDSLSSKSSAVHHYSHQTYVSSSCAQQFSEFLN